MPENISSQFNRVFAFPIETNRSVNSILDRDNIPGGVRWEGMHVYVSQSGEQKTYELRGGLTNDFWEPISDINLDVAVDLAFSTTSTNPVQNQVITNGMYQRTQLQTSGQAQVHWDNLTNVPSDIQNPTLQSTTDNGNETTNAVGITGAGNISGVTDGLRMWYLDAGGIGTGVIEGVSAGGIKSTLNLGDKIELVANAAGNSKLELQSQSGSVAGAEFNTRVTGLPAINNNDFPTLGQINTSLGNYQLRSEKGQANGYASLDASGFVPSSQLPPLAIGEVFVENSEAAMLGLTAQVGDVCVRTDENKSYILQSEPASTLSNWVELLTPGAPVQSVNGQTGTVQLDPTFTGGLLGITGGSSVNLDSRYEVLSNKVTDFTTVNNTLYPTTAAVNQSFISNTYNLGGSLISSSVNLNLNVNRGVIYFANSQSINRPVNFISGGVINMADSPNRQAQILIDSAGTDVMYYGSVNGGTASRFRVASREWITSQGFALDNTVLHQTGDNTQIVLGNDTPALSHFEYGLGRSNNIADFNLVNRENSWYFGGINTTNAFSSGVSTVFTAANNPTITTLAAQLSLTYSNSAGNYSTPTLAIRSKSSETTWHPWQPMATQAYVDSAIPSTSTLQEVTTAGATTNVNTTFSNGIEVNPSITSNWGQIIFDDSGQTTQFLGGLGNGLTIQTEDATNAGAQFNTRTSGNPAANPGDYMNGNNAGFGLSWNDPFNTLDWGNTEVVAGNTWHVLPIATDEILSFGDAINGGVTTPYLYVHRETDAGQMIGNTGQHTNGTTSIIYQSQLQFTADQNQAVWSIIAQQNDGGPITRKAIAAETDDGNGIQVRDDVDNIGLTGVSDYSANIDPLAYAQQSFVNAAVNPTTSAWQNIALAGGATATQARVRKKGNVVEIELTDYVQGTGGSAVVPSGYRPSTILYTTNAINSSKTPLESAAMAIDTTGNVVTMTNYGTQTVDDIIVMTIQFTVM